MYHRIPGDPILRNLRTPIWRRVVNAQRTIYFITQVLNYV